MKKLLSIFFVILVVLFSATTIKASDSSNSINALGNIDYVVDDSSFIVDHSGYEKANSAPSCFSLPALGLDTPVKNQNPYGTCWSFSVAASSESSYLLKHSKVIDLSELQLVYNMSQRTTDPLGLTTNDRNIWRDTSDKSELSIYEIYSAGGNTFLTSYSITSGYCYTDESTVPYSTAYSVSQSGLSAEKANDNKYYISDVYWLSFKDTETIKSVLMNYGAISFSFYWNANYFNYSTDSYYYPNSSGTNHAVTLVGWDDNYDKSNFSTQPSSNGAWLVKNSWGTNWGNQGYFWLSYEDATINSSCQKFICEDKDYDTYIYQYDSTGAYSSTVSGSKQITGANIYSSQYEGLLRRYGFYAQSANTDYKVEIYTDVTAGKPTSGTLAYQATGSCIYAGYNSFELDKPIHLDKNQNFSVCITVYSSSTAYFVVDKNVDNSWIYFWNESTDAQSFFAKGENGSFATEMYLNSNYDYAYKTARIKAYVDKAEDGFVFEGKNQENLTEYVGEDTEITIPSSTKTIKANVFANNTAITSVIIPEGVTTIESNAFSGCTNLKEITLPSTITSIAADSFTNVTPEKLNLASDDKIVDVTAIQGSCTIDGRSEGYHYRLLTTLKVESIELKAKGHNYGTWVDAKDATCESQGNVGYYYCEACKTYFDASKSVITKVFSEKLKHDYEFTKFVWANDYSCRALYTCKNNADHTDSINVNVSSITVDNPTCTTSGKKQHSVSYDGHTDSKEEIIAALDHDYIFDNMVWTDYSAKANYHCSRDTNHKASYDATVTSSVTVEPTCEKEGTKVYTATHNKNTDSKNQTLSKTGHNYQFSKFIWTDYTAQALCVCSYNSNHTTKYDATISSTTTAATCTTDGKIIYTASYNDNSENKTVTLTKLGHNYASIIDDKYAAGNKKVTCTSNGIYYISCTRENCGAIKYDEASAYDKYYIDRYVSKGKDWKLTDIHDYVFDVQALGHTIENAVKDGADVKSKPTCLANGIYYYHCSRCSTQLDQTYTLSNKLNHNYTYSQMVWTNYSAVAKYTCNNGCNGTENHDATVTNETTLNATCTTTGTKVYTATYDGHTDTKNETLSALNHDYQFNSFVWDGYSAKALCTCSRDNNHTTTLSAELTSETTLAPTCTTTGTKVYTATYNEHSDSKTETLSALNHDYQFNSFVWNGYTAKAKYVCSHDNKHIQQYNATVTDEVTTESKCESTGVRTYTATYDTHSDSKEEVLQALKHDYQFNSFVWNGYTAKAKYVCSHDNKHIQQYNATVTDETTLNATCTTTGTKVYTATYDGHTDSKNEILAALKHDYQFDSFIWNNYSAVAKYICSHDSKHIQQYNATVTDEVTTVAGCDNTGIRTYTATYDTQSDTKEEVLPIEHISQHVDATIATYTENGNKEYWHCSRCLRYYLDNNATKLSSLSEVTINKRKSPSKLVAPTISVNSISLTGINVKINKVKDADKYLIYRSTSSSGTYTKIGEVNVDLLDDGDTTTYVEYLDSNIKANTTYYYKVMAIFDITKTIKSSYSKILSSKLVYISDGFSIDNSNVDQLVLNINSTNTNYQYKIYRSTNNSSFKLLDTINTENYVDDTIKPNTYYYYKIVSTCNSFSSSYSSTIKSKTTFSAVKITEVRENGSSNKMLIRFNEVTDAVSYEIYRSTNKKTYTLVGTTSNDYYIDTVDANKTYYYKVIAKTVNNNSSPISNIVTGKINYTVGKITSVKSYADDSLTITFNKANYDSLYEIYRSVDKKTYSKVGETYSLSYIDTELTYNKTYYYKVRAYSNNNYTSYSTVVSNKVALDSPTIKVNASSATTITLDIAESNYANTVYDIYRSTNNKTFNVIKPNHDSNSYTDTVDYNKTYYYKVIAKNTNVKSSYSKVAKANTKITAVSNVKAVMNGIGSIRITFVDNNYRNYYQVYRSTNNKSWDLIKDNLTVNTYLDDTVEYGKTYYYKVKAVYDDGVYSLCKESSAVKINVQLDKPVISKITTSTNSITITYKAVAAATSYKIYRSTSSSGTYILLDEITQLTYVDNTTIKGKTYYYKVVACDDANESSYSAYKNIKSK